MLPQTPNKRCYVLQNGSRSWARLEASDARRLNTLEGENRKLKMDTMLDSAMLKDLNSRKW
jgi:hypothetical protein